MRSMTTIERQSLEVEAFGPDTVRIARASEASARAASVPYVRSLPTPF